MAAAAADKAAQAAFKVPTDILTLGNIFGGLVEEKRVILLGKCGRGSSQGEASLGRGSRGLGLWCCCGSLGYVLDRDRLGYSLGLLFKDGDTKLELGLCLCGTVKLLINGHVCGIEQYKGGSRVGVSLNHGLSVCRDV